MTTIDVQSREGPKREQQRQGVQQPFFAEMSRNPSIVLLGGGYSTNNMGVWALTSAAIASVIHYFPEAKIHLLDYSHEPATYAVRHPGGTVPVDLVNIRFSKKFWLQNNIARLLLIALCLRIFPARWLRARAFRDNPYLRTIQEADVVGSISGGDSFSDIYGMGRLLYVSLPQLLVILLGKPLVLLPQTLGPFKGYFAKRIGRFILRRAKVVYARDRESLKDVGGLVGNRTSEFQWAYDMAFALEPAPPSAKRCEALSGLNRSRPLVGLNVSGLLYIGGYTGDNMFALKADYRQLVRDLVTYFVEQDAHVLLVPHVFGKGPRSESDEGACAQVYHELVSDSGGRLHLLKDEYDHHELKYVIGQCDFFLGSRMHACIAALSQCVPTIGLAYSRKFEGVLGSVGGDGLVIDLARHDCAEVLRQVDEVYHRRNEIKRRLERRIPEVKAAVLDLFSDLVQQASKSPVQ